MARSVDPGGSVIRESTVSDYCNMYSVILLGTEELDAIRLLYDTVIRSTRSPLPRQDGDTVTWRDSGVGGRWVGVWSREALGCERDSGESRGGEQSWYESGYHWFQVKLIFGRDPTFGGGGGGRGGLFLVL